MILKKCVCLLSLIPIQKQIRLNLKILNQCFFSHLFRNVVTMSRRNMLLTAIRYIKFLYHVINLQKLKYI